MKQQLLSICLLFASAITFAQTSPNSTRLVLFEEFTGETCPPCASTNPGLNNKLNDPVNVPLVVAIKWQVPIPSAPSATWSLYKSNITEINWRYKSSASGGYGYPSQTNAQGAITSGINSAPSGRYDGQHLWNFGATSDHPTYVSNTNIATAQSYTTPFTVVLARELDETMSAFNVTVNILANSDFSATGPSNLKFRTVMVEKVINFSVQPGTNGEKKFENAAVKSFPTIQNGVALPATWVANQAKTFTLNCPIPSYILTDGHNRDVNQLDFVGFIQDDGNQKVAQAVRGSNCGYVSATASAPLYCEGDEITLSGHGGTSNYTWSNGQTGANITMTAVMDSTKWNYYATSSDLTACPNRGEVSFKVTQCTGIKKASYSGVQVSLFPNPSKGEFVVNGDFAKANIVIFNNVGQKVYEQALNASETTIKTNLAKGLYTYEITQDSQKVNNGKLVIE